MIFDFSQDKVRQSTAFGLVLFFFFLVGFEMGWGHRLHYNFNQYIGWATERWMWYNEDTLIGIE